MSEAPTRPRSSLAVGARTEVGNPLLREAAREVDGTLLDWALSLSPCERLRACSNATRALARFKRVAPGTR
jgi:hypothetical protein